ncbi:MAG: hypothetical protein JSU74_09955, partial [Candidatus Zixiibacteriota bacterium]
MIGSLITKIFGTKHERDIKKMIPLVEEINQFYDQFEKVSDDDLKAKTDEFKQRLEAGETLEDIMTEAFAVVKETCRRLMGQRWDVV